MKRLKYGNVKTVVDGIKFDSKKEAARYKELQLLERAGEIKDLELQPKFYLQGKNGQITYPNGRRACYTGDFRYVTKAGVHIIEDVKSPASKTQVYNLRKAILANMGILIHEV